MYYEVFVNTRSYGTYQGKPKAMREAEKKAAQFRSVVVTENAGKPDLPPVEDAPPTTVASWVYGKRMH